MNLFHKIISFRFSNKQAIFLLFLAYFLLAIPRLQFYDLDHGDEFTDASILIAGENYLKFGFRTSCFFPIVTPTEDPATRPYTTFPAGSSMVNGALRLIFTTSYPHDGVYAPKKPWMAYVFGGYLPFFRFVALIVGFFHLLFWYFFLKEFSLSPNVSLLGGLFFLTNPYFIYSMDSLGIMSYADVFMTLTLFLFLRFNRTRMFSDGVLLFVVYALQMLFSFEYPLFLFAFFVLFRLLPPQHPPPTMDAVAENPVSLKSTTGPMVLRPENEPKNHGSGQRQERHAFGDTCVPQAAPISLKSLLVFGLAPILGFSIHCIQNSIYFGGFSPAYEDLKSAAVRRVLNSSDSVFPLTVSNWMKHVLSLNMSNALIISGETLIFLSIMGYFLYHFLPADAARRTRNLAGMTVLLFVSGLTWYLCFPSHSLAHAYVFFLPRYLVPAATCLFLTFFSVLINIAKSISQPSFLPPIFCIFLAIMLCFAGLNASQLPVHLFARESSEEFAALTEFLEELRKVVKPQEEIGMNYYRIPAYQYYLQRKCVTIVSRQDCLTRKSLPGFFLFFPRNRPETRDLKDFLEEKFSCIVSSPLHFYPLQFYVRKNTALSSP